MTNSTSMAFSHRTDAELVGASLAGKRDAFAEIVSRYQTLVCSLAYSATGDLPRSEDLAQDTFLAVWRQLADLHEPEKLRAWVCGIARHRIQDSFREQYREPIFKAETLDCAGEPPAPEALPSDQAVREDETAIMWRALEQIPETYREPLILFHRENQSVERVAATLDLTEDTVKQRLVRGRKMLQAEVEKVVERTLQRTTPGRAFTSSIMAALPVGGAGPKVASGTAIAAKGASAGGWFGTLAAPLVGIGGLLFERKRMLQYQAAAGSLDERELLAGHRRAMIAANVAAIAVLALWGPWFKRLDHPVWFAALIPMITVVPLVLVFGLRIVATRCRIARIWTRQGSSWVKRSFEYRSESELLGQPLAHIRLGFDPQWRDADRAVKAWIAVGHIAHGRLLALGFVAFAPISFGGFAVGLVSVGAFAFGAVTWGAFLAAGIYAAGGFSFGWVAWGMAAFGAHAAYGCEAYAWHFAVSAHGPAAWSAYAPHANDDAARDFFANSRVTQFLFRNNRPQPLWLFLSILPAAAWEFTWEMMKRRRRPSEATTSAL